MKSTIVLAEDHEVLRDGLRSIIGMTDDLEVIAEAADGAEAVAMAQKHRPDVVVMDIWMPRLSGIDATRKIVDEGHIGKVLIVSQHTSWSYVEQALKAGASGYLIKTSSALSLLTAIRAVCAGKSYLSPEIAHLLVEAAARPAEGFESPLSMITTREREVLQLLGEGHSSKEIAGALSVSVRTADAHRASLMNKLDIHKVSGLVRFAIREGLIEP